MGAAVLERRITPVRGSFQCGAAVLSGELLKFDCNSRRLVLTPKLAFSGFRLLTPFQIQGQSLGHELSEVRMDRRPFPIGRVVH